MMQQIRFRSMGCHVTAIVDDDSERTKDALMQVPAWFEEWEQSLSRFRQDSELSQLNQSNGKPILASETLWEVTRLALLAHRSSNGLVTPSILPALLQAGYSSDFTNLSYSPQFTTYGATLPELDIRKVMMDPVERAITLPPGMQFDYGGIAKGWAAQRAADRLRAYGPSLVNVGGDISISAQPRNSGFWSIGIRDPFNQKLELHQIHLKLGGVATSGKDYRKWNNGEQILHHIIDPRTQKPAETDVLTATVIAPTTPLSEIAAKVIMILGSEKGMQWVQMKQDHAAFVVTEHHIIKMTDNFQEYFENLSINLQATPVFREYSQTNA